MSTNDKNFVLFQLNEQPYAISVNFVDRIIQMVEVSPLPEIDNVIGLINIHGEIITIIDLNKILKLNRLPERINDFIIVVRTKVKVMGFIVQEVSFLQCLDQDIVHLKNNVFVPFVEYIIKNESGVINILNIEKIASNIFSESKKYDIQSCNNQRTN